MDLAAAVEDDKGAPVAAGKDVAGLSELFAEEAPVASPSS
jgi:hypothetical protein